MTKEEHILEHNEQVKRDRRAMAWARAEEIAFFSVMGIAITYVFVLFVRFILG